MCTQSEKHQNTTVQKITLLIWQLQTKKETKERREKCRHQAKVQTKRMCMHNHAICKQKCMNIKKSTHKPGQRRSPTEKSRKLQKNLKQKSSQSIFKIKKFDQSDSRIFSTRKRG